MCGGSFVEDIVSGKSSGGGNNLFGDILDIGLQVGTGGLVGFEGGDIAPGITGKPAIEGLKEITGAAAAEEANADARRRIEEQKAAALQDREAAKAQTASEQLSASRSAQAVRSSGRRSSTSPRFLNLSSGGDERDFLGL